MRIKNRPQQLISEVRLFRIRVATAESQLKDFREQVGQAKRRRKEAKRIAQHARRQFKRSKAELAELRKALAKAEVRLFKAGGRALARKIAKARSVAKSSATPLKESKRRPRSRGRGTTPRLQRKKLAIKQTKAVAESRSDAPSQIPQFRDL